MGKYLTIDFLNNCSGYLHKHFDGDLLAQNCLEKFSVEHFLNYEVYWFSDNIPKLLYYILERYLKDKIIINPPYYADLEIKRDKGIKRFEELGILYPRTSFYENIESYDWKWKKGYIKPFLQETKNSTAKFNNKEELQVLFENYKEEYKNGFIIQEVIEGKEIAVSCFFVNGELLLPVYVNNEYKRSVNKEIGNNTGQTAEFGYFSYAEEPIKIAKKIESMVKKTKYTGFVDINGILVEDKFYALEWTISRDGYPTILSFIVKQDIQDILNKKLNIQEPFRYMFVINIDDTGIKKELQQDEKGGISVFPETEFVLNRNNWALLPDKNKILFVPERNTKIKTITENEIIFTTCYADNVGVAYYESEKIEKIDFKKFNWGVNIIYYETFNEENQERFEPRWFRF